MSQVKAKPPKAQKVREVKQRVAGDWGPQARAGAAGPDLRAAETLEEKLPM